MGDHRSPVVPGEILEETPAHLERSLSPPDADGHVIPEMSPDMTSSDHPYVDPTALAIARALNKSEGSRDPEESPSREGAQRLRIRVRARDISRKRKIAYLLAQEVRRIVEDLELRRGLLIEVWSKMRLRQPFLNVLRCRYEILKPDDLLLLSAQSLEFLDAFYRKLDAFRLYILTTEDMPTTLENTFEHFRIGLTQIAEPLLEILEAVHKYRETPRDPLPENEH